MAENPFLLAVGPVLIGILFNWGLQGAFLVQTYIYAVWYHHTDRGTIRYIVYVLFFIEAIQTGLMTHTGWEILASHWGDPTVLINVPWSSATTPIICGTVAMIVQLYFCWRIRLLANKSMAAKVVGVICALLSVTQCVAAVTYGAKFAAKSLNVAFFETTEGKTIAIVWLVCTLVCDVLITGSLIYVFSAAKERSLPRTGSVLNRLIIQTIQSGVITSIFAILHLAFTLSFPNTLMHIPYVYILSKLYPNVLLANLNNRNRLNMGGNIVTHGITLPGDSHTLHSRHPQGPPASGQGTKIGLFGDTGGIEMTVSTHRDIDDERKKGPGLSNV